MRIAYLDCFAGISGDMFLAALLDSGLDPQILHTTAAALHLNVTLHIEKTDRSGITATRITVLEDGAPAEAQHTHSHNHAHHTHHHGRSLSAIRKLILASHLPDPVKQTAIRTFELLGASEAKIHNVDIEKIHFHEVGAVDAIVDIVCAAAGIHALNIDSWHCSPINTGSGMVHCAHGNFPVPAPATADLLRNLPTYAAHVEHELTTPTGAAILRALAPAFGPQPAMRVEQIGYGAGSRNTKSFPNVLRLSIGETIDLPEGVTSRPILNPSQDVSSRPKASQSDAAAEGPASLSTSHKTPGAPSLRSKGGNEEPSGRKEETVTILSTAIDDLSPQILAHVTERALALGALDVMSTAVQMKKGRLGTLLTILADTPQVPALEDLLLRETSTLGIRIHQEQRLCLDRAHHTVTTPYGDIRIKTGSRNNEIYNAAPEFEDCRTAAATHNVPVKQVHQAAIAAWHNLKSSR